MAVSANNDTSPPVITGGYDFDFVDPPPYSLQCPVCLSALREPALLSCCGVKGCASCIGRIKAAGKSCPICQPSFDTMLDKQFQRKVLNLCVFCSNKEEGCEWKGELRDIETHLQKACDYVEEECRYGCGRHYQRRLLRDHEMDECAQRPQEVITQSLIRKMAKRMDEADKIRQEDQIKLADKLAAVEEAHRDDQAMLNERIQKLQLESTTLQDEKKELTKKIVDVRSELQQG